jgi:uncharacterized protein (TIGR03437 family)
MRTAFRLRTLSGAAPLFCLLAGTPLAGQSASYWRYLKSETFESPEWNGARSPVAYRNSRCPGEKIKAEAIGNSIRFERSIPFDCTRPDPAGLAVHTYTFSPLDDVLQAGSIPNFTAKCTVTSLAGKYLASESTAIFAGFVPFDSPPQAGPHGQNTLAQSGCGNSKGVGSGSAQSNETKKTPEKPLVMPAHPWLGSGVAVNGAKIRFRVRFYSGAIWKSIDRVYQWTSTGPKIGSVVNGLTFENGVVPGSWVTIRGMNLAATTRVWTDADFGDNGSLPTALDAVRVNINGRPAYISYVSFGQLNVLAPEDNAAGPVQVEVINSAGRDTATAWMRQFQPGFYPYEQEERKYVIAFDADWGYLAKPGLIPGITTRGARPGETITLHGSGFGPTDPPTNPALVVTVPSQLVNRLNVYISGVQADLVWAGQVGSGLYQITLVVPEAPDGDQPIVAEIGGTQSPDSAFITVQR